MDRRQRQSKASAKTKRTRASLGLLAHWRSTESYRRLINITLERLAKGHVGRADAYAIRILAVTGAEMVMSWGMQRQSPAGIIEFPDDANLIDQAPIENEIELEATESQWSEETPAEGVSDRAEASDSPKIVTLIPIAGGRQDDEGDE